jgi:SPFH domain / Band 7 family
VATIEWGVVVTLVELKDIQLPESMKRAMARQAEAEREKRAKIIAAEGEALAAAALGTASDTMMAHPLALQLRNLQSSVEIGVDKNTTVVFPAPLTSTIGELGAFLSREAAAAVPTPTPAIVTLWGAGTRPPVLTWFLGGWFVLVDQAPENGSTLDPFRGDVGDWVVRRGGWRWSARCGRRRL